MPDTSGIASAIQQAIDNGATTVEEVHKSIASMSLDQLAKIAPLEQPAGQAKELHDRSVGVVYDTIRRVNKQVSEIAPKMLSRPGGGSGGTASGQSSSA